MAEMDSVQKEQHFNSVQNWNQTPNLYQTLQPGKKPPVKPKATTYRQLNTQSSQQKLSQPASH